jgi:hypothetical protein
VSEDDVLEVAKALAQKKIKLENDTIVPNVKHKIYKIHLSNALDKKLQDVANQQGFRPEELITDSIESSLSKILD